MVISHYATIPITRLATLLSAAILRLRNQTKKATRFLLPPSHLRRTHPPTLPIKAQNCPRRPLAGRVHYKRTVTLSFTLTFSPPLIRSHGAFPTTLYAFDPLLTC